MQKIEKIKYANLDKSIKNQNLEKIEKNREEWFRGNEPFPILIVILKPKCA